MKIDDYVALIFAIFVFVCAVGASYFIAETAYHHYQDYHVSPPKDTRPKIPQCDKALWERITEGCDDEGHD